MKNQTTIAEKILTLTRRSPLTRFEIAAATRKSVTSVCGVLDQLQKDGRIKVAGQKVNRRSGRYVNTYKASAS